jgi:death-on-curing protein
MLISEIIEAELLSTPTVCGDAYLTIFEKAAALMDSLAKNYSFHNGNKRTAYAVTKSFLLIIGYHLKFDRDFAVKFMVDIARFLKEHCSEI